MAAGRRATGSLGAQLRQQRLDAGTATQQHRQPATLRVQRGQRLGQGPGVADPGGVQQVQRGEGLVHAHRHRVVRRPLAVCQRQVPAAPMVGKRGAGELALRRDQLARAFAADQGLVAAAVLDQIGDGADLQTVFPREDLQIRQAGHRTFVRVMSSQITAAGSRPAMPDRSQPASV
jgi:hypothetical protein